MFCCLICGCVKYSGSHSTFRVLDAHLIALHCLLVCVLDSTLFFPWVPQGTRPLRMGMMQLTSPLLGLSPEP